MISALTSRLIVETMTDEELFRLGRLTRQLRKPRKVDPIRLTSDDYKELKELSSKRARIKKALKTGPRFRQKGAPTNLLKAIQVVDNKRKTIEIAVRDAKHEAWTNRVSGAKNALKEMWNKQAKK